MLSCRTDFINDDKQLLNCTHRFHLSNFMEPVSSHLPAAYWFYLGYLKHRGFNSVYYKAALRLLWEGNIEYLLDSDCIIQVCSVLNSLTVAYKHYVHRLDKSFWMTVNWTEPRACLFVLEGINFHGWSWTNRTNIQPNDCRTEMIETETEISPHNE